MQKRELSSVTLTSAYQTITESGQRACLAITGLRFRSAQRCVTP